MKPTQAVLTSLERALLEKGEEQKRRELSDELASLLSSQPVQPPRSDAPGHDQYLQIQQKIMDLKEKMIQKQQELLQEAGREEKICRDLSHSKRNS